MDKPKILFMGTPEFAKTILQALIDNKYNIIGVVCQPDRLVGRKKVLTMPSIKVCALENNIPVFQKEKIKDDFEFVKELNPDLILTCAYGQFVPDKMLKIPPLGALNIHGSLLPSLRGGAPIQHAIIDGYEETGVTLMEMIKKMDAGKMYASLKTPINNDDTYDSLSKRLQELGVKLILDNLPLYLKNELKGIEQDESKVTFGMNISREEEKIDFNKTSKDIHNLIRGLCSIPGAYAKYQDFDVKVFNAEIINYQGNEIPGTILKISKEGIIVKTYDKALALKEIQLPGKSRIAIKQYINGNCLFTIGSKFGD